MTALEICNCLEKQQLITNKTAKQVFIRIDKFDWIVQYSTLVSSRTVY